MTFFCPDIFGILEAADFVRLVGKGGFFAGIFSVVRSADKPLNESLISLLQWAALYRRDFPLEKQSTGLFFNSPFSELTS